MSNDVPKGMKPQFEHGCEGCRLFCVDKQGDWYVCESSRASGRSILCRYGNKGADYRSGGIAECVELTRIELQALARGLTFTAEELRKTVAHLCDEKLGKLGIADFGAVLGDRDEPAWRTASPVIEPVALEAIAKKVASQTGLPVKHVEITHRFVEGAFYWTVKLYKRGKMPELHASEPDLHDAVKALLQAFEDWKDPKAAQRRKGAEDMAMVLVEELGISMEDALERVRETKGHRRGL